MRTLAEKEIIAERGRLQMTIWRMVIACRIQRATNTHTHTLLKCTTYCFSTTTIVVARWASMLIYTYVDCIVEFDIKTLVIKKAVLLYSHYFCNILQTCQGTLHPFALMTETSPSTTLVHLYQCVWCHTPNDSHLVVQFCCEPHIRTYRLLN
jgi:hypothetical protein